MNRFTETQAFPAFVYLVIGLTAAAGFLPLLFTQNRIISSQCWFWLLMPLGLVFNLLCQKTTVTERDLTVTFGAFVPLYRRQFARPIITSTEAVTYNPLADYGGWGIRGGRNIALNARGNRGVQLVLQDGRRVLVGSQRPEELARALNAR